MAITEHYIASDGAAIWGDSTSNTTPCSLATALANAAAGDRLNIKVGTYQQAASLNFNTSGSTTSPIILRGVDASWAVIPTTRANDNGAISATLPEIAFNSGFRWTSTGAHQILNSLKISGIYTSGAIVYHTNGSCHGIIGCIVLNNGTATTVHGVSAGSGDYFIDSDIGVPGSGYTTSYVVSCGSYSARVLYCRISSGGTSYGVYCTSGMVFGSVIYACGNPAVYSASSTNSLYVFENTLVDTTGSGVVVATGYSGYVFSVNNRITDSSAYAMAVADATTPTISGYNRLDRNTSGASAGAADWFTATSWSNNTTAQLKAAEYVDAASRDYTLASTAEGAAEGIFMSRDMGALQTAGTGDIVVVGGGGGGGGGGTAYYGSIVKGTTSYLCHVMAYDSGSGDPKTGLSNSSMTCSYMRAGATASTAATVNSITTLGTFAGSATAAALKEVNASTCPGLYEFQAPNNALATGANRVIFFLKDSGSSSVNPIQIELELVAVDLNDGVRAGLTALPNAAAGATSGLPIGTDLTTATSLKDLILGSALPGTYVASTLGYNVGTYLTGAPATAANVWAYATREITGVTTAGGQAIADALLDRAGAVETGMTPRQCFRVLAANAVGKLSGANSTTVTIRNAVADNANRIVATVDEYGNRSALTLDLT
jgi:hypothetical protein